MTYYSYGQAVYLWGTDAQSSEIISMATVNAGVKIHQWPE